MPFHPDFEALLNENDNTDNVAFNFLQDDTNALRTTRSDLESAFVRHQQQSENSDMSLDKIKQWDCLRRYYRDKSQIEEFSIILDLASRHSLIWTNQFIDSLVQLDTEKQTFIVNTKRLKTLIFLKKYFGLQSRDLSVASSIYEFSDNDIQLLNRDREDNKFFEELNTTFALLKDLKEANLINWITFLVRQGFLNFTMLNKKCSSIIKEIERSDSLLTDHDAFFILALTNWLTQWTSQCDLAKKITNNSTFETEFIADNELSPSQCTIRNTVRYGLSPKWLNTMAVRKNTESPEIIQVNATLQSALAYPISEDDTEPHWIQIYTKIPEDQQTLRRLCDALSLNEDPALERLKFYHDYGVLPELIKQIQKGKLSLAEVAEYDKPLSYKEHFDEIENSESKTKSKDFKDFCINNSPRILPRLLAKFSEPDPSLPLSERIKKMAEYDMYDYRPKPNPVSDEGKDEKVKTFFRLYDDYLQNYFNQVILPIAEERARLYLELIELKKKNEEQSYLSKSVFGSFDAQIHLVEQKIDIFSGFLEEACYEMKRAEMKAIDSKKNNCYDDFCAMEYPRYIRSYCEQIGFDDYWKRMKIQLFASDSVEKKDLSHQEVGIYLDKDGCLKFCYNQDVDGSHDVFNIMTDNLAEKLNPQMIKYIKEQLAHNKQNGVNKKQLTSKNEIYTIVTAIRKELLNSTVEPYGPLEQMKQNSLYRLERAGLNHASDEKNPQKTRSECREPVMNTPQNPVRSCLAFIIGKILAASKLIVQIPLIFSDGFGWKKVDIAYSGVFYNTRSHQTFFNSLKNSHYMGEELERNFNNLKRV